MTEVWVGGVGAIPASASGRCRFAWGATVTPRCGDRRRLLGACHGGDIDVPSIALMKMNVRERVSGFWARSVTGIFLASVVQQLSFYCTRGSSLRSPVIVVTL